MNAETSQNKKIKYNDRLVNLFGKKILEANGFVPIAGAFIVYQKELNLTDKEIILIAKVIYFSYKGKVEFLDRELDPTGSGYYYQRKNLREKGYLNKNSVVNRFVDGVLRNCGVVYDFSGLL